jgi:RimJ/RimL family protein N-acetyltransferase
MNEESPRNHQGALPAVASELKVRPLRARERGAALRYLDRAARLNLSLIDLVLRMGRPSKRGEGRPELIAAYRGRELVGVAALHPAMTLDASAGREVVEAFFPFLAGVGSGLVKSSEEVVGPLWEWLHAHGRQALLDRIETGYTLEPHHARLVEAGRGVRVRPARGRDLDLLVEAARASLREESRPDPFKGDPVGFRRWVRGRVPRATVAEVERGVRFVGYADVQCERGWLLQGIYTWPRYRRRGLAAAGVSELCRNAFASAADHVQLSVVEGNTAAEGLYERLGFRPFARLRTILFR